MSYFDSIKAFTAEQVVKAMVSSYETLRRINIRLTYLAEN